LNNQANKIICSIVLLFGFAPPIAFFLNIFQIGTYTILAGFIVVVSFLLFLVIRDKNKPIRVPGYIIFFALFTLYVLISDYIFLGKDFEFDHIYKNRMLGTIFLFILIENLYVSRKFFTFLLKLSKYTVIFSVVVIVVQQAVDYEFLVMEGYYEHWGTGNMNSERLPSIFSWVHTLSIGFGFICFFAITLEWLIKRKKNILIWLLLGIVYVLLTKGRWVMLNFALVPLILFYFNKQLKRKFFKYVVFLFLIVLTAPILMSTINIDVNKIISERIFESDKTNFEQKSASTRILAFVIFADLFPENPVFGVGDTKYGMGGIGVHDEKLELALEGRSSQLHVGYLSLFYYYGLVGGFLFLIFLYLLLKRLFMSAKKTGFWAPFIGFLGFAVANLTLIFFDLFEMGLVMSLVANQYYIQNYNTNLDVSKTL